MRKVLASLKPYYYYLVGEGIKKIEVRKGMPKASDWDNGVLFYMSKDEKSFAKIPKEFQEKYRKHFGKVGMQFICDKVDKIIPLQQTYYNYIGLSIATITEYGIWNDDLPQMCLTKKEINDYGKGKTLYGWHISDLKIYDKPRELSEFSRPCSYSGLCFSCKRASFKKDGNLLCNTKITRPPQSWMHVEELGEEK